MRAKRADFLLLEFLHLRIPFFAPKAHFRVPAQTTVVGFWPVLDIYLSLSREGEQMLFEGAKSGAARRVWIWD